MDRPSLEQSAAQGGPPTLRREQLAKLSGLITEDTGLRLAELAADVEADLAVVEVGSFRGRSTCYLAEGARCGKGARVWAIDPWDLEGNDDGKHGYARESTRMVFVRQVVEMDLGQHITPIRGFSTDVAARWSGPPIGLLFIDGSHTYEDVKADFAAWSPHLAPAAVVALDDYGTKPNPGVTRFVEETGYEWDLSRPPLAICRPHA